MRALDTVLACSVIGLACFIGGQAVATSGSPRSEAPSTAPSTARSPAAAARIGTPDIDREGSDEGARPAPATAGSEADGALLSEDHRRRLLAGGDGSYMGELLEARDGTLVRWPNRTTQPLRIWIATSDTLAGWSHEFPVVVRDAFATWLQVGLPIQPTFVTDSASADVHVGFTTHFDDGISGKTVWTRDQDWWLVSGTIQLALAHPLGGVVTPPQMRAIALHEVGHLLGLDHVREPDHIMSARVRVRDLSHADRATVRLLYSVPAGRVSRGDTAAR